MVKQVHPGEDIYIAPRITGKRGKSGELIIIDDLTNERLYPNRCIEHKIRIFERQVKGWFLDRASNLVAQEDNGFVILMIATAYIEGIEQYRRGKSSRQKGESRTFFKEGVKRIFFHGNSRYDHKLCNFYSELRCGLFHNGMTGPNIRIRSTCNVPVDFSDSRIIEINQRRFLEKVKEDFEQYLTGLRDPKKAELRENFKTMYTFNENRTSHP